MATLVVFGASLAAGGFGSLVGVGGGLIIVPVLSSLLGYDIKVAIAASLVGVIATSVTASVTYLARGIADRRLGLVLLVATAAGGITGSYVGWALDGRVLALLFGALLLVVVVQMLRQRHGVPAAVVHEATGGGGIDSDYVEPRTGELVRYRARRIGIGTAISFVAGNVSGLLGVGGGIVNVPTMTLVMGVPVRVATTTSTYMLGATAAAGAIVQQSQGRLDPLLAAPVVLGVLVGARLGARVAMRTSQEAIRVVFAVVTGLLALQMLLRAL